MRRGGVLLKCVNLIITFRPTRAHSAAFMILFVLFVCFHLFCHQQTRCVIEWRYTTVCSWAGWHVTSECILHYLWVFKQTFNIKGIHGTLQGQWRCLFPRTVTLFLWSYHQSWCSQNVTLWCRKRLFFIIIITGYKEILRTQDWQNNNESLKIAGPIFGFLGLATKQYKVTASFPAWSSILTVFYLENDTPRQKI